MHSQTVRHLSKCFIRPSFLPKKAKQAFHLGPFDLDTLSVHYIQKGLLFKKTTVSHGQESPVKVLVQRLKDSLSVTLAHFYPLAGLLATKKEEMPHSCVVFIDCVNSPRAKFVHSKVDLSIVLPIYVPSIVKSFFDHNKAVSYDGHTMSLLTVQVTELKDGVFVGCSMNHSVADGTSYEHVRISRPPIRKRWFPDRYGPVFSLPFTHSDQFLSRYEAPELKERIFHVSEATLARIKAKANSKCGNRSIKISSLQALCAIIWRCVTRVRELPQDETTSCKLAVNNRSRLDPPLSHNYFGNCIQSIEATTTTGILLTNDFEWASLQLYKAVAEHDNKAINQSVTNSFCLCLL